MFSATEVIQKMAKRHQFSGAQPLVKSLCYLHKRWDGNRECLCCKMDALCVFHLWKKVILFVYLAKLVQASHTDWNQIITESHNKKYQLTCYSLQYKSLNPITLYTFAGIEDGRHSKEKRFKEWRNCKHVSVAYWCGILC